MKRKNVKNVIDIKDVYKDVVSRKALDIDESVICDHSKSYNGPKLFRRWSTDHYSVIRNLMLKSANRRNDDLQLDYLRSVITNFDTSDDSQLLTDLLTFIGIVLSIILAMLSSNSEKPIWENVYLYIIAVLLIIISYSVIMIKIKYTPRNRFFSSAARSAYEDAKATINGEEEHKTNQSK